MFTAQIFQFHKGTIKTKHPTRSRGIRPYFNSIKVRLKPFDENDDYAPIKFQFHKGTIKTLCYECSFSYYDISIP